MPINAEYLKNTKTWHKSIKTFPTIPCDRIFVNLLSSILSKENKVFSPIK